MGFYVDGVSFTHKSRPMDQAKAPRGLVWRTKEGVYSEGEYRGNWWNLVKVIIATSYDKVEHCDEKEPLT